MKFTLEWFSYITSDLGYPRIFSIGSYPDAKLAVSIENSIFRFWINSGIRLQEPISGILNTWVHFAIVYDNGTINIFRNGVKFGNTFYYHLGMTTLWDDQLLIGGDGEELSFFSGRISNFRYTADALYETNFNPSLNDYTVLPETKLLLKFDNQSDLLEELSGTEKDVVGWSYSWSNSSPIGGEGSLEFLQNGYLSVSPVDDFDFIATGLETSTTTLPPTTTTTSTTTAATYSSTTTTTSTSTSTSTTSTTTFAPKVGVRVKQDYMYEKILNITQKGNNYFIDWVSLVNESIRVGEYGLLSDVLLLYYKIDVKRYLSVQEMRQNVWNLLRYQTQSLVNVQLKKIFDEAGVYRIGLDFYLVSSNMYIGRILEEDSPFGVVLNVTTLLQEETFSDSSTSIFQKYTSAVNLMTSDSQLISPTPTPSITPTVTPTPTLTRTPNPTKSPTKTPTQTPTNTRTLTPTNTSTYTPTPSETPTNTPTNTQTSTPTNTQTPTNTLTPTQSPTNTETPTQTSSSTQTPTNTQTQTQTNTPTNTETPTNTPTNTPTVTPSVTQTNT